MIGVVITVLGFAGLIVAHELGHMLVARLAGVRVKEFSVGFGPPLLTRTIGNTAYSLRIGLVGGFVKIVGLQEDSEDEEPAGESEADDSFKAKPTWKRAAIIIAGPLANALAAALILAVSATAVGVPVKTETEVQSVLPDSFAAGAGLAPGDHLVSVNGRPVESWEGYLQQMNDERPGEEVTIAVDRGEERIEYTGALTASPDDQGRAIVGIVPVTRVSHSPIRAAAFGVEKTAGFAAYIGESIVHLLTGQESFSGSVAGPVGIAAAGGASVSGGYFPQLLALLSLNLGILNLLPVLPLDGGYLMLLGVEKLLGRPVGQKTLTRVNKAGFVAVGMLFLVATYSDLGKMISGQ